MLRFDPPTFDVPDRRSEAPLGTRAHAGFEKPAQSAIRFFTDEYRFGFIRSGEIVGDFDPVIGWSLGP